MQVFALPSLFWERKCADSTPGVHIIYYVYIMMVYRTEYAIMLTVKLSVRVHGVLKVISTEIKCKVCIRAKKMLLLYWSCTKL